MLLSHLCKRFATLHHMQWILVGLGNPGEAYIGSRHNVGKEFLEVLRSTFPLGTRVIDLNVYMNNSGAAIRKAVPSHKAAERLVVLHDDLDLPLGVIKISFGSGSGGHRGVESIIKALKTKDFVRIRIGISPATPSGKIKKPEQKSVVDFVLGKFKPGELTKLKSARKKVSDALEVLFADGLSRAMTEINSRG